jgi:hypothetical protein
LQWYREQTRWGEEHGYDSAEVTSPKLRAWYLDIIKQYPAMNGPDAVDDPDNPKVADYSVGRSFIYAAFAWSQAEPARAETFRLAEKYGVGFFDVSVPGGGVWVSTPEGYVCVHGNRTGPLAAMTAAISGFLRLLFNPIDRK